LHGKHVPAAGRPLPSRPTTARAVPLLQQRLQSLIELRGEPRRKRLLHAYPRIAIILTIF
jgi:hypothetical protein